MKNERKHLTKGIYRIYGPIKIEIIEGSIFHLGRWGIPGQKIVIPANESTSFYIKDHANVDITYHTFDQIVLSSSNEEPILEWLNTAEEIVKKKYRIVMILGEPDSGKSSFTGFLANYAYQQGLKVNIIDSDVGQNDIGYPGCISSVRLQKHISWLRELRYDKLFFVGSITPSENIDNIILGVRELIGKSLEQGSDITIVNTDGWIEGIYARKYKSKLVMLTKPDTIIIMSGSGKADYLCRYFSNIVPCFYLQTPKIKKIKEKNRRKIRREISYIDIFFNGVRKTINLDHVSIIGSSLFNGNKVTIDTINILNKKLKTNILHIETFNKSCIMVVKKISDLKIIKEKSHKIEEILHVKKIITLNIQDLIGIVIGLLSTNFEHVGIGIIQKINFEKRTLHILSSLVNENIEIKGLIFGNIKIEKNGRETRATNSLKYL